MCEHQAADRWAVIWRRFLIAVVGGFAVIEGYALATEGSPATLSTYLRRLAGLEQQCRHRHVGRAVILAGLGWAAGHLGWGLFGLNQLRGKRC